VPSARPGLDTVAHQGGGEEVPQAVEGALFGPAGGVAPLGPQLGPVPVGEQFAALRREQDANIPGDPLTAGDIG
jgi:hypothetical protein